MKLPLIISTFLSGCIGISSENYEIQLHKVEGFIVAVANADKKIDVKPTPKPENCPCKGTGKIRYDGRAEVTCPCGENCKCPKETNSKPKEQSKVENKIKYKRQVLFFTASWCTPCNQFKKDTLSVLQKPELGWKVGNDDYVHIRIIDVDKNPEYMSKYNFQNIPLFILIEDGKEIARKEGVLTPKEFTDFYNKGKI